MNPLEGSEFFILNTAQLKDYAEMVAKYTIENYRPKTASKEPLYSIYNPVIIETFPDLKIRTLFKWCSEGKVGRMGRDGKYWIRLSELERFLFK